MLQSDDESQGRVRLRLQIAEMLESDNDMRVIILLIVLLLAIPIVALGQLNTGSIGCSPMYENRTFTKEEFKEVLENHEESFSSTSPPQPKGSPYSQSPVRRGADLSCADLSDARLNEANLSGADLTRVNLMRAYLVDADLSDADLSGAHLSEANLSGANLSRADLIRADLSGANLSDIRLSDAILNGANLSESQLVHADLIRADLSGANLSGSDLIGADLRTAILRGADLSDANLSDRPDVKVSRYNWRNRKPEAADLSGANLSRADLSGANLHNANLSGADLSDANLTGATYEPLSGKEPNEDTIVTAVGLSTLKYSQPRALVSLRRFLKNGGYRNQEREVTYAIHRVRNNSLLHGKEGLMGRVEGAFNYVLFELTTKWGMAPGRALIAIFALIFIFSLPYLYAVWVPKNRVPKTYGIWRIWADELARTDLVSEPPELLREKGFHAVRLTLYFSLLTAFHVGWRDLNVGNWITRIQPREYTLRASGWVRTVSGIQSLLSVYLLSIWVLTYFGRPFE